MMRARDTRRTAALRLLAVASLTGCFPKGGTSHEDTADALPREAPVHPGEAPSLRPLAAAELCVTHGALTAASRHLLRVGEAEVRAVAPAASGDDAELFFRYEGPTTDARPLRSGQLRRQIGLKLHARDGCNLLYVMWRIEPAPGIVVSIKTNPDARTGAECGTRGYTVQRAQKTSPAPTILPGEEHVLRASLRGRHLDVYADGDIVWTGELDPSVLDLQGPVGLRTDNGMFVTELRAAPAGPRSGPCAHAVDTED